MLNFPLYVFNVHKNEFLCFEKRLIQTKIFDFVGIELVNKFNWFSLIGRFLFNVNHNKFKYRICD